MLTMHVATCGNGSNVQEVKAMVSVENEADCMHMEPQTFQFDFGDEEKIYSTTFEGVLSPDRVPMLLQEIRKHLYRQSSGIIKSYLERYHLKYSHFDSKEFVLAHDDIMTLADCLLHSDSYDRIHGQIGSADNYYATMDYQNGTYEDDCEGCYYTIKKITGISGKLCSCKIIGQIFSCLKGSYDSSGYFVIRTAGKGQQFQNLVEISGDPVIPTFGCVDVIRMLMNIDTITTSGQAEAIVE